MPLPTLLQEIRGDASQLLAEYKKAGVESEAMAAKTDASGKKMHASLSSTLAPAKTAALGIAGVGLAIAGLSVAAAVGAQTTDAKLNVAIKNTGESMAKLQPQINATQLKMRDYGFSNDETRSTLAEMTTALGDPKKAMADMAVAANLARAKNIDLAQAGMLVARTSEGQVRGLKSLGIDLPVAASSAAAVTKAQQTLATAQAKANAIIAGTPSAVDASSKAHKSYEAALASVATAQADLTDKQNAGSELLAGLSGKVKGAASAYGDTLKGQLTAAGSSMENLGEKIGAKLIPMLTALLKGGTQVFDWLVKNKAIVIPLAEALGTFAGVILIVVGALKAWAAIQAILNIVESANPVGLIIIAIAALIAIVVLLVTHWKQVVEFLTGTWKNAMAVLKIVGDAIASWWNGFWKGMAKWVLDTFGPGIKWIIDTWQDLQTGMQIIGDNITKWWNGLWTGMASWILNTFGPGIKWILTTWQNLQLGLKIIGDGISKWWNGLWSGVVSFVQSVWKGAGNGVIGFINNIIDAINVFIQGIDAVGAGIKKATGGAISFSLGTIPHIPSFDVGGILPGAKGAPSLFIGHGGEPVISHDMLAGRSPMPSVVTQAVQGAQPNAGGGYTDNSRHVTVQVESTADPAKIVSAAAFALEVRRRG